MGLWVDMQDENVQPSEEFMSRLAQILKKNKKKVPFSVSPVDDKKKFQTLPQYDKFQEAMAEEDFVTAEKILTKYDRWHILFVNYFNFHNIYL